MKKEKKKLCVFTIVLLFAVSVISVLFGIMMYKTNLEDTYGNLMHSELTDTVQKIRYGVSFGKSIENYYGVEALIQETADESVYIEQIYVTGANGGLLYQTGGGRFPAELQLTGDGTHKSVKTSFFAAFSLTDHTYIIAQMRNDVITSRLSEFSIRLVTAAGAGFLAVSICIAAVWLMNLGHGRLKKFSVCIVVLWVVILGIYAGGACWKEYSLSMDMLKHGVETSVEADIQRLENAGIPYGELDGMEEYLELYSGHIPEFDRIYFRKGELQYEVSSEYIRSVFIQYVLNTVLLSVISILIVVEYQLYLGKQEQVKSVNTDLNAEGKIRAAAFMLYACINIGKSMNAVVSGKLAAEVSEKSAELLTSMPASAAMLGSIAGILLSFVLTRYMGSVRRYLGLTAILTAAGLGLCAGAGSLYLFTAARAVLGFGEGILFMGIRNYCFQAQSSEKRTKMLAYITGGGFGGICLGSVAGGMLSDHVSYASVFLIAAAGVIGVFPMIRGIAAEFEAGKGDRGSVLHVLKNPGAVRYLACLVFPVYAGAVFLDYVLPLAGNSYGFSHTVVSALILFNCLIAGYASPVMSGIVMKKLTPFRGAVMYCALYGGLIFAYAAAENAAVLVLVVLALGACDSFGLLMISEGFIQTKGKYSYKDTEANIIFTLVSRAGQLSAPVCIAWSGGCTVLAGISAAGLGIYGVTGRIGKRRQK